MALPSSRNRTYAAGAQILAADLNDLQDMIIGGKHGPKVLSISPSSAIILSGAPTMDATRITFGIAGQVVGYPVNLHAGDRITKVEVFVNQGGGNAMATQLVETDGSDWTGSNVDTEVTPGGAGTFLTMVMDGGSIPYTIPADNYLYVDVDGALGGGFPQYAYHVEVTYDRP